MRILSCFMPASSGSARVAGLRRLPRVAWRCGAGSATCRRTCPSTPTCASAPYLDFVAEVKGVSRSDRRRRVADVMDRCMVADVQNRLIGTLSKGYRQRVGLAQAIVSDPEVLILDEPTIGLDPRQITEIRSLIKSLAGQHTVILSTHILPEVSMVCSGGDHHQQGRHRRPGADRQPGRAVLPDGARRGRDRRSAARRPRSDPWRSPASCRSRTRWSRTAPPGTSVEAARGRDVRAEIFKLAAQQQWDLLELRRVGMTLEEVFIRIVAGEEGGEAGRGRGGGRRREDLADLQEGDASLLHVAHRLRRVLRSSWWSWAGSSTRSLDYFTMASMQLGDEPADGPRSQRHRERHATALREHLASSSSSR